MGALATTCGLFSGTGPIVAVGAGVTTALAITGSAAMKHLEEKRDIELDDAYFLWKGLGHHRHHAQG